MFLSKSLLFLLIFIIYASIVSEGGRVDRGWSNRRKNQNRDIKSEKNNPNCPLYEIPNGFWEKKKRGDGQFRTFLCKRGFRLIGHSNLFCKNGRWDHEMPFCAKAGCTELQNRDNAVVKVSKNKLKMELLCDPGYVLASSPSAFCNGKNWDRKLGECRLDSELTEHCDFETHDTCGWTQDGDRDFDWVRRNGWNLSNKTNKYKLVSGPRHDHTIGRPLEGHYMVAETSNIGVPQKSRFTSPMYRQADSLNAYFHFFYYMFGKNVGRLRLIVKPIDLDFDEIETEHPELILFENTKSSDHWREGHFPMPQIDSDFQIVFEAFETSGNICDIAIDDVALLKYDEITSEQPTTTEEVAGIFDWESCENRCSETESERITTLLLSHFGIYETDDGHMIEKCDCHSECVYLDSCCLDYYSRCSNDLFDSPKENVSMETESDSISSSNTTNAGESTQEFESTETSTEPKTSDENTTKSTIINSSTDLPPANLEATTKEDRQIRQKIIKIAISKYRIPKFWNLIATVCLFVCFLAILTQYYLRRNNSNEYNAHQVRFNNESGLLADEWSEGMDSQELLSDQEK